MQVYKFGNFYQKFKLLAVAFNSLFCWYVEWCVMCLSHTAMIRALKALQDNIRALELERAAASEKFHHLGQQADQHKQQQHSVRQQLNKSSQYNTPPSDTSNDGECGY